MKLSRSLLIRRRFDGIWYFYSFNKIDIRVIHVHAIMVQANFYQAISIMKSHRRYTHMILVELVLLKIDSYINAM